MNIPKPGLHDVKRASITSGRIIMSALGWAVKILGTILLIVITTGSIMAVIFAIYFTRFMDIDLDVNLADYSLSQTSIVYYNDPETGRPVEMGTLHGNQNRLIVKYAEIPQHMIDALVSIEDKRFYEHHGVDWKRTGKAVQEMFTGESSPGGSTITQQLIKNVTGEKDVTVQRKMKEIFRALEFEKIYTKEEILEWYMNASYFGSGCYGVKAAAEHYFGKELKDLTAAESACIIGITQYPSLYDPYLNPEKNKERQEVILGQMYEQEKLTEAEYKRAVDQPLVLARSKSTDVDTEIQSYFMDQVFFDVTNDLMESKGISRETAQTMLYNAGYRIYTTVDMRIQGIIDEIYADEENYPVVKNSEKPQSSILIMDPYNGSVLGMGQRGTKTANLVQVLAAKAQRQPGSSIKPVTVYSAAMDLGIITPYSVIDDAPLQEEGGRAWPKNSGGGYKGRTNIITAVQNSVNTIAVRVVNTMTPRRSYDFGYYSLGLKSLVEERVVTTSKGQTIYTDIALGPLALGGLTKGLTVRELTAAYCAFPNKGIYTKPRTYSKIEDSNGNMVLDNSPLSTVAMKEKTAYYMNTVLQQVVRAGTGSRARFDNMAIAGKTGTTTEDKDRWFVGYTPYYVAGSWFGFEIPKKITLAQSTNPALAMWKLVMERVHEDLEPKEFFEPEGLVSTSYCLDSGLAPTDACRMDPRGSRVASGKVAREDVVKSACDVHVLIDVDVTTNHLATPYCPPENVEKRALLNLRRSMPVSGVVLGDEQYTVRYWDGGEPDGVENSPVADGGEYLPYNAFCPEHKTPAVPTPTGLDQYPIDPITGIPLPPDDYPIADVIPTIPPTPDIVID